MDLKNHILNTIYQHVSKSQKKIRILFPEAENEKIQAVAAKLATEEFLTVNKQKIKVSSLIEPVLLVTKEQKSHNNFADNLTFCVADQNEQLAQVLFELRKNKGLTLDQAQKLILQKNYYGMMLLKTHVVDCLVAGINFTTADVLRPALQIIKPKPGIKTVASCFIMNKNQETFIFADGSINIKPSVEQLEDIAKSSVACVQSLNLAAFDRTNFLDLKVALLSYSTNGSGTGEDVEKMHQVAANLEKFNWGKQKVHIAGEIQFDAAWSQDVRAKKFPQLNFTGPCNIYIFPDLNAANIGYKIAQRLGNYKAIGPIVMGLNQPVNDLSRGATIDDIYFTALITCAQSLIKENK